MQISIGIDAAKEVHWATAVTGDGRVLLDRKVLNTGEDIGKLATDLATLGGERLVGIDLLGSIATLLSAMLLAAGERLVHVPGLAVNRARQGSVGGQNKSDPKDARVIADQLRLRPGDFRPITVQDETVAELRLLVSRRVDLVTDQTRRISRMRYLLNTIHPDLERALDLTNAGPLLLLTRYVTAAQIRAAKPKTIARFLRSKDARNPDTWPTPPTPRRSPTPSCISRPRPPRLPWCAKWPKKGFLPNPGRRDRPQARRTRQAPP